MGKRKTHHHSWEKILIPLTMDIDYWEVDKLKEEGEEVVTQRGKKTLLLYQMLSDFESYEQEGNTLILYEKIGRKCRGCPKRVLNPKGEGIL